jgi:hypothetical protein
VIERRQLGIDVSNDVWTLMDKPDRTREEDDLGLHEIHASADRRNAIVRDDEAARRQEAPGSELGEPVEEEDAREHLFEALETLPR